MNISLALHGDDASGAYLVEVEAAPSGVAGPGDYPFASADVSALDEEPAKGDRLLRFVQAVASPLERRALDRGRLLSVYVYQPRDRDEILAFDRRITERYTEFFAEHGELYAGTFLCEELGSAWVAEWTGWLADDREAASALIDPSTYPADIAAIVEECRSLQNRDRERYVLWLRPR